MATIYRIRGKQFESTGDPQADIQAISAAFPDADLGKIQSAVQTQFKNTQPQNSGQASFGQEMAKSSNQEGVLGRLSPDAQSAYQSALDSGLPADEVNKRLNAAKKLQELSGMDKVSELRPLASSDAENISSFLEQQKILSDMIELKNSGFGGKGIDTGPLVGGSIPGLGLKAVPDFLSSFLAGRNNVPEGTESDRARLRKMELSLLNPIRKRVTGAGASEGELSKYISPTVPSESDNDKEFFQKGFDSLKENQMQLNSILSSLEKSGYDVSGFKDEVVQPDDKLNSLLERLASNSKGSYAQEFPEAAQSFLSKKLKKQPLENNNYEKLSDEELLQMAGLK